MTKAIAPVNTQLLVGNFTQNELETLKGTIAKGTSNEQFALFVQTCASSGLNPFLNQIYCITYNGKDGPVMSIQIAVEGIVALAKKNSQYKGFIASEVKENDEFEIDVVTGEPIHKIKTLQRGKTIGAYCVSYREGTPNMAVIITNDQVEHLLKGRNGSMWKDYFDDMIVKHAIKRSFKRQFGIEVAEDEYINADNASSAPESYVRRDITAEADEVQGQPREIESPPAAAKVNETAQVRQKISTAFKALGVTDKDAQAAYMQANCKVAGEKPTLEELNGLLKVMEMEIAEKAAGDEELE
ncbi:RecT protein [Paenibacillus sp. FSL H8-0548]|uniref:RecT family recombinase n=1 Tax=Paenibacillus sp. FSL H8-0548 TaxID=1920422 RepID=UPI00096E56D9|nr:RecT family recombinase [Paenibacillus sp. FSL H8-0548]OMF35237.1 RecT protein [Paenibacillus sp. FSL H8-0548]